MLFSSFLLQIANVERTQKGEASSELVPDIKGRLK